MKRVESDLRRLLIRSDDRRPRLCLGVRLNLLGDSADMCTSPERDAD
jgi:hypothetical protein